MFQFVRGSEVLENRLTWVWENWIPRGYLSMIVGPDRQAVVDFIIAGILRPLLLHTPWLDGRACDGYGSVVWLVECDTQDRFDDSRVRFPARKRVRFRYRGQVLEPHLLGKRREPKGFIEWAVSLNPQLVIVDLEAWYPGITANTNYKAVREILTPLAQLARERAVLLVHESGKGPPHVYSPKGSSEIGVMSRSTMMVYPNGDGFKLVSIKRNLSARPDDILYRIVGRKLVLPPKEPEEEHIVLITNRGQVLHRKDRVKNRPRCAAHKNVGQPYFTFPAGCNRRMEFVRCPTCFP